MDALGRGGGSRGDEARTLTPEELRAALDAHRRWVETGGAEGRRADLGDADLAGVDLEGAVLQGAVLSGACLKGADLGGADLQDADLSDADLQGAALAGADLRQARLRRAVLRDADLREADLTGARGLLGNQLAGADLAAAKLPDDAAKFEGLANVTEASKTTQGLFFTLLFVCAYAWLTVASTRDAQLLNNAAPPQSRLPILGTDIPLVQFYLVAPLLLLSLYVYFHLCLQRLWEELGELPAVFPDGRTLDRKAYPWLMNVLVRAHAARLRERRSHLARWQSGVSVLLAWGLVPLTLAILWARYLRAHDWAVTLAHVGVLAVATGAGVGFLRLAAATLRGAERRARLWQRAWSDARMRFAGWVAAGSVAFGLLSLGAIEGINPAIADRGVAVAASPLERAVDLRHWVPRLFTALGYSPFAQLDDASLSTKPPNWSGGTREGELATVRGADLEGRNLRYAAAYGAFCVNGYLRRADARGADLRRADFRHADAREADLRGANLRGADLSGADLRWSSLAGANLKESIQRETDLDEANAAEASFVRADLTGATLTEASLRGADLTGALLQGADLTGASLRGADLTGATLKDAVLAGADLTGADLTGVVGLTREQLASARHDATTRLPEALATAMAGVGPEPR